MDWLTPEIGWVVIQPSAGIPIAPALYETTDGGQQWTAIRYGGQDGSTGSLKSQLRGIEALHFTDPQHGALVASLGVGACQAEFAVWTTSTGGQTWSPAGTISGSDGPVSLMQDAPSAPLWVADGSCAQSAAFLFESSPHGWQQTTYRENPPGSTSPPTSVVLLPEPTGVTLVADYGDYTGAGGTGPYGYVTRIPGGRSTPWTFPGQGWVQKMAFLSPAFGWIQTSRHLYQTVDQGGQWTVVPEPVGRADTLPVIVLTGTVAVPVAWFASGPHLWRSGDDGQTWTEVSVPWVR